MGNSGVAGARSPRKMKGAYRLAGAVLNPASRRGQVDKPFGSLGVPSWEPCREICRLFPLSLRVDEWEGRGNRTLSLGMEGSTLPFEMEGATLPFGAKGRRQGAYVPSTIEKWGIYVAEGFDKGELGIGMMLQSGGKRFPKSTTMCRFLHIS